MICAEIFEHLNWTSDLIFGRFGLERPEFVRSGAQVQTNALTRISSLGLSYLAVSEVINLPWS